MGENDEKRWDTHVKKRKRAESCAHLSRERLREAVEVVVME